MYWQNQSISGFKPNQSTSGNPQMQVPNYMQPHFPNQNINQGNNWHQSSGGKIENFNSSTLTQQTNKIEQAKVFDEMDWQCKSCQEWNYGDVKHCTKCKSAFDKSCTRYDPASGTQIIPTQSLTVVEEDMIRVKRGDWDCPKCAAVNFRNKKECFRCSLKLSRNVRRYGYTDDWSCSKCFCFNQSTYEKCDQCSKPHEMIDFSIEFDHIITPDNNRVRKPVSEYPIIVSFDGKKAPCGLSRAREEFDKFGFIQDMIVKEDIVYMIYKNHDDGLKACKDLKMRFGTKICDEIPPKHIDIMQPTSSGTYEVRFYRSGSSLSHSTRQSISDHFSKYGVVKRVTDSRDGYVYVEFGNQNQAANSLEDRLFRVEIPPSRKVKSEENIQKKHQRSDIVSKELNPKIDMSTTKNNLLIDNKLEIHEKEIHECKICKLEFTSNDSYEFHCNGSLHSFKMKKVMANKYVLPPPDFFGSKFYFNLHSYFCKLCNMNCKNQKMFDDHVQSPSHMHCYDDTERAIKEDKILDVIDRLEEDNIILEFNKAKEIEAKEKRDLQLRLEMEKKLRNEEIKRKEQEEKEKQLKLLFEERQRKIEREELERKERELKKIKDEELKKSYYEEQRRKNEIEQNRKLAEKRKFQEEYGRRRQEEAVKRENDEVLRRRELQSRHNIEQNYFKERTTIDFKSRSAGPPMALLQTPSVVKPLIENVPTINRNQQPALIDPETISILGALQHCVRIMRSAEGKGDFAKKSVYEQIARQTGVPNPYIIETAMLTLRRTDPMLLSLLENLNPTDLANPRQATRIMEVLKFFTDPRQTDQHSVMKKPRY